MVKIGELESRLDPFYYKNNFKLLLNKLSKINCQSLSKLGIDVRKGVFDMSPSHYTKIGIPFLRVSDIKEGTINFENTVYISEQKHQEELYTEYLPNDLVISKVGTIGEVSILPNTYPKYNISQNVVGLKLKLNLSYQIIPKFLQICLTLSFGMLQFNRQFTTGVQPKITLNAIRKILIPIPPLEIQNQIVEIMDNAYNTKKQKEAEAQKLLDSIDDYLLGELGIELPQPEENTVTNRIFYRKLSDISGGRFDPYYNQQYFNVFKYPKSSFPIKKIKEIAEYIKTGLPVRKDFRINNGKYPYYGANGIIGYMDEFTHDGLYVVVE